MNWTEIARAAWRLAGSAIVSVAFLVFLAVASAQHEAVQALEGTKSGLSYSVARDTVSQAEDAGKHQQQLKAQNATLLAQSRDFERQKFELGNDLYGALQNVDLAARSIIKSGNCDSLPQGTNPPGVPDLSLWKLVELCAQQGSIPSAAAQSIKGLQDPKANPAEIKRRMDSLDRDIKENADLRASNDTEIDRLGTSISSADQVRNALQDVRILERNRVMGAFNLTSLPPRILPIFLTFFAGMFGALLITLILVVYPNNDLNLTTSDSFWYRIGLGGLIAVAIYVVLGGGLATVGSNNAVAIGDTNFMFFCAIGILAGMFSDRAAGLLSSSAAALTSRATLAKSSKAAASRSSHPGRTGSSAEKQSSDHTTDSQKQTDSSDDEGSGDEHD